MNFPRYDFSKENSDLLLEFLKLSKENKSNKFCNVTDYDKYKEVFRLQDDTKMLLNEYISKSTVYIDLTSDKIDLGNIGNEIQADSPSCSPKEDFNTGLDVDITTVEDITYAIKENLENEKSVPTNIITQMNNLENLESLFTSLSKELNVQAVTDFGKILIAHNVNNNLIIAFYVKCLLLEKANDEFTEGLGEVFNQLALKFQDTLVNEISKYLFRINEECSRIFLQFLDKLDIQFKTNLLKMFLFNCNQFEENYIPLVETLLTNQTDMETFGKLVDVISARSDHFSANKTFGKLLLNIVTNLGKYIHAFEPTLNHIIISHKSIWKSKIQKSYDSYQQDSQFFTQSFR